MPGELLDLSGSGGVSIAGDGLKNLQLLILTVDFTAAANVMLLP